MEGATRRIRVSRCTQVKIAPTESYTGRTRKPEQGEQATTWLAIYGGQ
ncbi:hypothetical protein [Streptomyces melanogenes]|nr:hypothetical protein [Streptomyces melanogenes]